MTNQLIALLDGREVGTVTHKSGRLSFTYSESWLSNPNAYPLSLSMPLGSIIHGHKRIEPFLWGLLPDNERVLQSWGKEFHVSPRNVFRLIEHVGEDCAGAVQFVSRERLEAMVGETVAQEIAWISQNDIAKRLTALRSDHSAWRVETDAGRFSLAGAQPKTALLFDGKRWGVPSGRTPTTHILKPPTGDFEGHAENEHFSLQLARSLGIIVPNSKVLHFGDEIAIVVERYDRVRDGASWSRVHQEDMCQALGLHPTNKYESDGGPGIAKIVELIQNHSSEPTEDVEAFTDAIAFNWLIAGTDAHAKNYSLLIGSGAGVRLAPIYDLASILPYRAAGLRNVKLAMKIGGEYRFSNIGLRHWQKMATELRLDEEALIDRVRSMALAVPDTVADIQSKMEEVGLPHETISKLAACLRTRAMSCLRILQANGGLSIRKS
jgi:serine/threonine-protein kinase HipA